MTNESEEEIIPFDQIPMELMHGLPSYSITLVRYRSDDDTEHCGCGTLVKSGDDHFILTAAHCMDRFDFDELDKIAIPVPLGGPPLKIQLMSPIHVGEYDRKRKSEKIGPDLAFLPIHHVDVGNINAKLNKLFYDLEKYKDEILGKDPTKIENSLWAIVGTPACESNVNDPLRLDFSLKAYRVEVKPTIIIKNFDYIDIPIHLNGKNVLPTYKGLSGGALWQAEIERKEDGSVSLVGPRKLVGCAFYESEAQGQYGYVRCHGPRGIYEQGLAKLSDRKHKS